MGSPGFQPGGIGGRLASARGGRGRSIPGFQPGGMGGNSTGMPGFHPGGGFGGLLGLSAGRSKWSGANHGLSIFQRWLSNNTRSPKFCWHSKLCIGTLPTYVDSSTLQRSLQHGECTHKAATCPQMWLLLSYLLLSIQEAPSLEGPSNQAPPQ